MLLASEHHVSLVLDALLGCARTRARTRTCVCFDGSYVFVCAHMYLQVYTHMYGMHVEARHQHLNHRAWSS